MSEPAGRPDPGGRPELPAEAARPSSPGPRVDILFGFAYDPDVRVRRISQALASRGYEVRIFAWDRARRLPQVARDGDVEVRRVHVSSYPGRGWTQLFFLARAVVRYVPHIIARRPDVLHAVDLPMLLAALLIAPLTGRRPRIVYDAFEIYAVAESHKYPRWLLGLIAVAERTLPRFADLVITAGESRREYFHQRGIGSIVIPNWVDVPLIRPDREVARAELGIDPRRLVLVYAGGMDASRDLATLVRHAQRHPEHHVLIAGRGELEGMVSARAKNLPNLRYLGWLADPSVPLMAADIVYYSLLPGHAYAPYAAPNNLYTAIAYAVPMVFRAQGEISRLAAQHEIGAAFDDDASFDAAVAHLARAEVNARIREELRRLQPAYQWRIARDRLLAVYPGPTRGPSIGEWDKGH